jgi:hypothetical protein
MEQSNEGLTNELETTTVTPTGVGESLTAAVPLLPPVLPTTFTKVDNNLTGIGFFTASSKRSRKFVEKTTVVFDQGVEHKISILPSAKYGLPITQDQDYWLALMKLVSDHIQREGRLANPFLFSTAQITKMLGQAHSGKNYKAVEEWLSVMAFTGVEGGVYNVNRKTWYTEKTHALDRVVIVGKKLPDGSVADKNHIWFSQWQLDNINAGNLIAIELTIYTQLETNIARNLVPHLQEWLFASQHQGRFEKQYEDVCQLLGIRMYQYLSDIERKFGPSLNELVAHGYISKWAIEPMSTRKGYKLVLWHGRKYHADRQTRLNRNPQNKSAALQAPMENETLSATRERRPRQKPLPLLPEVNSDLLAAMMGRGISETATRKLLTELPAGYPTLDTLEWGDTQVSTSRGKITNPPGFYISLLRDRTTPPPTFESSAIRKARHEADLRKQQALQEEEARRLAEEEAEEQRLDQFQAAEPQAYQALYDRAKTELYSQFPNLQRFSQGREDSAMHDGAIRARIKIALRQARSQAAAAFAASLKATLYTPQLPAPKLSPALPETDPL